MRRGLAAWLEVLPVAVVSALRLRLSCRQQRAVHTPDPRAPEAVLHCEGRVRSSVRDEDVHVGETSHVV